MLEVIGVPGLDDLFDFIPPEMRAASFDLPAGRSEFEVMRHVRKLASANSSSLVSLIGAGFYSHCIPAAVSAISSLPEFYTAYTPYQPEASQGWLQAIYEYQSAICRLVDLEVSNASLYDGGTALYEACMMAVRCTGRRRIIVDAGVNLIYRTMIRCYTRNLDLEVEEVPAREKFLPDHDRLVSRLDERVAAVVVQNPNFFGVISDYSPVAAAAAGCGVIPVSLSYPVSLGILKTPGEMGFEIAVGEGQSLGIPLSFGGPYLGFMAAAGRFARRMPGRMIGRTVDQDGRDCFVMTLQAREQHIRRHQATSNICSNESLCALRALVYLCLLGRGGLRELCRVNMDKADFARRRLAAIPRVEVDTSFPVFNEFPIRLPGRADDIVNRMIGRGFIAGFPLGRFYRGLDNYLLVAVTEQRTREEISIFAETLEAVLCD